MSMARREYRYGLLIVTAAVVAWSTAGLFTKILSADTPTILFWRGLFGALGTCLFMAVLPHSGGIAAFRQLGRPGFAYAALTGVAMLFFVSALGNTSVAHVAVITAIVPFVAAYLGWVILKETPSQSAVIASVTALVGVTIMVGLSLDGNALGDILACLMAVCMGGMILISRRFANIPALAAMCVASAISAAATLPFATLWTVSMQDFGILALFATVNQVLGFGLFALGARLLPPMETALLTTLEAPLAPFWVWLVLAETPGEATVVGGAIVLAAVAAHLRWAGR